MAIDVSRPEDDELSPVIVARSNEPATAPGTFLSAKHIHAGQRGPILEFHRFEIGQAAPAYARGRRLPLPFELLPAAALTDPQQISDARSHS